MIVEDDRVVARDLAQQLAALGHSVAGSIARGEEAVARAIASRAELVLMDIRLEGSMDGIAAAQALRDRCQIPVVFLTAYADAPTVRRATDTEPFGYLLKPFEELQLATAIEMALHKHAAERKLRASERRYATTLSSIGDGVIATDAGAAVSFMNPVAEALTGWSQAEALGRPIAEVFRLENQLTGEPVADPAAAALRSGVTEGLPAHTVLRARDGREVPIDDSSAPVPGEAGSLAGAVVVFTDMTRRRAAEEALRRAQAELAHASRLAVLGELAVSIAHEVNQPLMAAITNAEACLRWLAAPERNVARAEEAARRVVRNGHRAAEVIDSIRAMARNAAPERERLALAPLVEDVLLLMRAELKRAGIALRSALPADLAVEGVRVQLQQVVMNLVLNAREALEDGGGTITLAARAAEGRLLLSIADDGPGVAPAVADRIFDPLFTTKPGGMGLGLSICRSILEAHGGSIRLAAGEAGSRFEIDLPAAGAQHAAPR
ncbi:ATP-binding protein [Teichococcus deserti]|uniref:ATP-binding response regulator n=1 Tax=Teichococcus deserti TaxID=1817963 RepID=UPI0013F67BD9|nr:ATP-binding protein [Pseudoroseomonas deserti]